MATSIQNLAPPFSCRRLSNMSSFPSLSSPIAIFRRRNARNKLKGMCRAMVEQTVQGGGAASAFAKEMERLSAKESLLLAVSSHSSPFFSTILDLFCDLVLQYSFS